jgi:nucleoside-diphosphate-sugar epimerase
MAKSAIIITGASGLIGRHLIDEFKQDMLIFALARRSQRECDIPPHENIIWMRADIADLRELTKIFDEIKQTNGAKYLIHLAAYYDFTGLPHPEYHRTNVVGTRNILYVAESLDLSLLIFASSVAACSFPPLGSVINEKSPADDKHLYSWTKGEGEALIRKASNQIPGIIVRLGAVYSDWCEYPPLYVLLNTWGGTSWMSRIIAGNGESALPYIHVIDVCSFFRHLILKSEHLNPAEILIASTSHTTSHRTLFQLATRYNSSIPKQPIYLHRMLTSMGLFGMYFWRRFTGRRSFERPWMRHYIDKVLAVDGSYTYERLGWSPDPKFHIERRLPFLIDGGKSKPHLWRSRNIVRLYRETRRPGLWIFSELQRLKSDLLNKVTGQLLAGSNCTPDSLFKALDEAETRKCASDVIDLLLRSIWTGERLIVLNYVEKMRLDLLQAGLSSFKMTASFFDTINEILVNTLLSLEKLSSLENEIYDRVTFPLLLLKDGITEQHMNKEKNE